MQRTGSRVPRPLPLRASVCTAQEHRLCGWLPLWAALRLLHMPVRLLRPSSIMRLVSEPTPLMYAQMPPSARACAHASAGCVCACGCAMYVCVVQCMAHAECMRAQVGGCRGAVARRR
mgnify:CR=1 FL=1